MTEDSGRASGLHATGFDPARGLTVHGLKLPGEALRAALAVLSYPVFRLDDVRGCISRALYEREFDFGIQHNGSVLDRAADRYLQRMKKAGLVRYLGGKAWAPSDRDRDREADETQSGSVERSEIEPGPKASPNHSPPQPPRHP